MNTDFLCERKLQEEAPRLHQLFKDSVFGIQGMLNHYQALFPAYTDHTSLHSMQVIQFCNQLIGENIGKLNATEIYALLMGCYLHDLGMGISQEDYDRFAPQVLPQSMEDEPLPERIRKYHQEFSARLIRKYASFFEIPNDALTHAIVQIARGHRRVDLFDSGEYPAEIAIPGYEPVHLPYLAALIRLADELDVADDRVFIQLVDQDAMQYDPVSAREHEKLHAISHTLTRGETFVMQVHTQDEKLAGEILTDSHKVEDTLLYCRRVIVERTPFTLPLNRVEVERI